MKPTVKVTPEWMAKSLAWSERSVLGYANGEKEASRQYARPGIDKSVDKQLLGKAGDAYVRASGVARLHEGASQVLPRWRSAYDVYFPTERARAGR